MPRLLPIFALLIAAAILRFHDLPTRVMHTDEAVHAVTLGRLLAGEAFAYDPKDYHGPSLHYSTLPVAWARGQTRFEDLDESTLRGVTAGYGVLLVAMSFLFRRELTTAGATFAAILVASSPMMVFFSRYYIMELPFAVFLTLLGFACWRFTTESLPRRRRVWWILAGVAAGLLHATKETFVLHVAAMVFAAAVAGGRSSLAAIPRFLRAHGVAIAAACLLGFAVSALLLSHGLQRPEAIWDGIRTYLLYLQRAEGTDAGHNQPWNYYFIMLFFLKPSSGFWYSEIGILILGLAGAARAWWPAKDDKKWFPRALAAYTIATMVIYSLIPYKTPWSFLATLHGLTLLSGYALAGCLPSAEKKKSSPRQFALAATACLAFAATLAHALLYDRKMIAESPADPEQPLVYGHTSQPFLDFIREIHRLEAVEGRTLTLSVAEDSNGWPIPWYRRYALNDSHFGRALPDLANPPDILAVSTDLFPDAAQSLLASHLCKNFELRPEVALHVFFRRSLSGLQDPPTLELRPNPSPQPQPQP